MPRYQCRACGKNFCATQVKPIAGQHRPDLNRRVFELAVSGASMRRMAVLLECAQQTIQDKIEYLAAEAKRLHQEHMENLWLAGGTAHVMMDELETLYSCPVGTGLGAGPGTREDGRSVGILDCEAIEPDGQGPR